MKKLESKISDIATVLALVLSIMCFYLAPQSEPIFGAMFLLVACLIQLRKIFWVNK